MTRAVRPNRYLREGVKPAKIQHMNTDENEIQSEQDDSLDETPSGYVPYDGDTLMVDELAEFSAVADETIQAVDEMYGGVPPIHSDFDSALIVASVTDVMAEQEAEREFVPPAFEPSLPMPPMTRLRRGQLGSLVPALLLIGIGAWLTLTTTAGTPPNSMLVAAVAVGAVVITLLAQWIAAGRWGRGYLFFAMLILLVTGILAFSIQPNGLSLVRGWPLLIVVLGIAVIVSGVLSRPADQRLLPPGILLVTAGLLGVIVTSNVLPQRILAAMVPLGPAVLIVLALVWLLPLVFRRRG